MSFLHLFLIFKWIASISGIHMVASFREGSAASNWDSKTRMDYPGIYNLPQLLVHFTNHISSLKSWTRIRLQNCFTHWTHITGNNIFLMQEVIVLLTYLVSFNLILLIRSSTLTKLSLGNLCRSWRYWPFPHQLCRCTSIYNDGRYRCSKLIVSCIILMHRCPDHDSVNPAHHGTTNTFAPDCKLWFHFTHQTYAHRTLIDQPFQIPNTPRPTPHTHNQEVLGMPFPPLGEMVLFSQPIFFACPNKHPHPDLGFRNFTQPGIQGSIAYNSPSAFAPGPGRKLWSYFTY